jgi:DNA modification methylase
MVLSKEVVLCDGFFVPNQIIQGNCLDLINKIPQIDLLIIDPPYQEGWTNYFLLFKEKLKPQGQMLWFCQPIELYELPEKPHQILIWKEPYSPKPIRKKYREFLDVIAWYAYGDYTFNPLMWNLMNSVFEDEIIRKARVHKWEKPITLMEKLVMIHSNENDLVVDLFCGSGSTVVACKRHNRNYIGIELNKDSYDCAVGQVGQNLCNNSIPVDIIDEMDADMEDSGMAQGEIESCLIRWNNKYVIGRKI